MKYLLIFSMCFSLCFAQNRDTAKYNLNRDFGVNFKAIKIDSALIFPRDTIANKRGHATIGSTDYIGNGTYWTVVSSGGSTDTSKVDKITGKALSDKNFTAPDSLLLLNTSGVNTGDQDLTPYATKVKVVSDSVLFANTKQDTTYSINDSTLVIVIGGRVHNILLRGKSILPLNNTFTGANTFNNNIYVPYAHGGNEGINAASISTMGGIYSKMISVFTNGIAVTGGFNNGGVWGNSLRSISASAATKNIGAYIQSTTTANSGTTPDFYGIYAAASINNAGHTITRATTSKVEEATVGLNNANLVLGSDTYTGNNNIWSTSTRPSTFAGNITAPNLLYNSDTFYTGSNKVLTQAQAAALYGGGGSGTVTSVGTGYGLTGGTITNAGVIIADTNFLIPYTDTLKFGGIATQSFVLNNVPTLQQVTTAGDTTSVGIKVTDGSGNVTAQITPAGNIYATDVSGYGYAEVVNKSYLTGAGWTSNNATVGTAYNAGNANNANYINNTWYDNGTNLTDGGSNHGILSTYYNINGTNGAVSFDNGAIQSNGSGNLFATDVSGNGFAEVVNKSYLTGNYWNNYNASVGAADYANNADNATLLGNRWSDNGTNLTDGGSNRGIQSTYYNINGTNGAISLDNGAIQSNGGGGFTATSFITTGSNSSQFVKGDGSLDSNNYATTTSLQSAKGAHTIFTPTTGSTITSINNQINIVNPSGALLALTIALPASPANNDVVEYKFTKAVTTVTYSGGTIAAPLTSPIAGSYLKWVYDADTTTWY